MSVRCDGYGLLVQQHGLRELIVTGSRQPFQLQKSRHSDANMITGCWTCTWNLAASLVLVGAMNVRKRVYFVRETFCHSNDRSSELRLSHICTVRVFPGARADLTCLPSPAS